MYLVKANDARTRLFIMTLEDIFTLENLNEAFYASSKISHWKDSTQRYNANLLLNNIQLREDVLNGEYRVLPTQDFILHERGKVRQIKAPSQQDRIVQKVLCSKILIPQLTKPLIYDNYASLKDRGTSFARKRIDVLLQRFIRQYGSDGYILQIDIRKYFDSIDHEILKKMVHKKIHESQDVMDLIDYVIDSSSDGEVGLNLGAEAPQILAIYYLSEVDNFIKSVKGMKFYGRYMDDMFIFSNSKDELKNLLSEIKLQLSKIKLEVNDSKTNILRLSHGFTFMQIKYSIDGDKIIKRPTRTKITRERRRLKKFKHLYIRGDIKEIDIRNCYKSWRFGILKDCNACYKTVKKMDSIYNSLFPRREVYKKQKRSQIINKLFKENMDLLLEIGYDNRY